MSFLTVAAPIHPSLPCTQAITGRGAALAAPVEPAAPTLAELGITDIDMADANDPHNVAEYVGEIYKHFRTTEVRGRPWCGRRRVRPLGGERRPRRTWCLRAHLSCRRRCAALGVLRQLY